MLKVSLITLIRLNDSHDAIVARPGSSQLIDIEETGLSKYLVHVGRFHRMHYSLALDFLLHTILALASAREVK